MLTKDAAIGEMKMYLNGALWQSDSNKTIPIEGITWFSIGTTSDPYNGRVDEFRISTLARESNWIKLSYATQKLGSKVVTLE